MKTIHFSFPLILSLVFLGGGCSKVDKIGPELNAIYSKVEIAESLTVSKSNPNFANSDRVAFNAKFVRDAYWILTLTGATSGATKTFTGTSTSIDPAKVIWDGRANGPASFLVENVLAKVKFPYSPEDSMSVTINVAGARDPNTANNDAVLITDFESTGPNPFPSGNDMEATSAMYIGAIDSVYPVVSNKFFRVKTTAIANKGNFATYLGLRAEAVGHNSKRFPLYANPDLVYFNMMVYNTGDKVRYRIDLLENEVDASARYIEIVPDWVGWKMVSVKYKDFLPTNPENALYLYPQRINKINIILFTEETNWNKYVSFAFDKMIFTHMAPYQP